MTGNKKIFLPNIFRFFLYVIYTTYVGISIATMAQKMHISGKDGPRYSVQEVQYMMKNSNNIHINSGRGQNNFPLNTFWYSTRPMDWFHTTLYTRVLVNITKLMKNHPICGARFSVNIWNSLKIFSSLHLPPFHNVVVWFKSSNIDGETCTTVLSVFFVWLQPQKYLSLFGALFFSFALVHT